VTSNVAQSYPYSSETEPSRAAAVAALIAAHPGLERTIADATTALGEGDRWWVWKCPTAGCAGLLHVAGYARDLHALFVVCDGSCARTFLR
jgi:hypothetical protein